MLAVDLVAQSVKLQYLLVEGNPPPEPDATRRPRTTFVDNVSLRKRTRLPRVPGRTGEGRCFRIVAMPQQDTTLDLVSKLLSLPSQQSASNGTRSGIW